MARPTKHDQWRKALSIAHSKMTPEIIGKLKEAFAIGANIKQACYYAEIHVSTYHDWVNKNPALLKEFERMRQRLPLAAKTNIASAIQNAKDIGLSKWLVERQEPEDYAETLKIADASEVPSEDKEAVEGLHTNLKENLRKRSQERAKNEGEL